MELFEKVMRYLVLLMAFLMHLGGLIFLLLVKVESSAVICFIGSLGTALFFLHDILKEDHQREKRISKNHAFEKPEQKYH